MSTAILDMDAVRRERYEKQREKQRRLKSIEDPGRRRGSVAGSYMHDVMALRQSVMLCSDCVHKLGARRRKKLVRGPNNYVLDEYLRCNGPCDDCRKHVFDGTLRFFVHESYINVSYKLRGVDLTEEHAKQRRMKALREKFPSMWRALSRRMFR